MFPRKTAVPCLQTRHSGCCSVPALVCFVLIAENRETDSKGHLVRSRGSKRTPAIWKPSVISGLSQGSLLRLTWCRAVSAQRSSLPDLLCTHRLTTRLIIVQLIHLIKTPLLKATCTSSHKIDIFYVKHWTEVLNVSCRHVYFFKTQVSVLSAC